ncbi:MAG: hypothetical protein KDA37_03190 [Planctomycetales bacterium]|nr:hypothetical protein [Planctomycetales bacterium]
MRPLLLTFCCLVLPLLTVGCGPQTPSQRLVGEWVGRPDTFAAQKQRNPIPTAAGREAEAKSQANRPAKPTAAEEKLSRLQPSESTDLEAYDFSISLDFLPDGKVEMALTGQPPLSGQWRVLSTDVGVSRLEIVPAASPDDPAGDQPTELEPTRRVFTVRFDKSGDGFTLREEGADIRFGWLYFQRPHQPLTETKP